MVHHSMIQRLRGQYWESCTIQVKAFSADESKAIDRASHGLFPGEDCTAGSRVYVQDSVYDRFIELLIEKVKSTPIGDGFDETVTSGPIVSNAWKRPGP